MNYQSQAARDAAGVYNDAYADYIESHALELSVKFPDRAGYFMRRSLGESLAGNDGE